MKSRNIVLGAILIVFGLLWLLGSLNVFDYSISYLVTAFFRLWPLIIIMIGASIIIHNKVVERALWVIFLLVVIGYSIFLQVGNPFANGGDNWNPGNWGQNDPVVDTYSYPMEEDLTEGELRLQIGATLFNIDAGSRDKVLELDTTIENLYVDLDANGQTAFVDIDNQGDITNIGDLSDNRLELGINDTIPWTVFIECGAVESTLDFSDIPLKRLDLSLGAGKMSIRLGNEGGQTVFNMKSGVSQVDIYLPEEAALVIEMTGALNSTNIDSLNLSKDGNTYTGTGSGDMESAIVLNLEVGLGEVMFHRY